MESRTVESQDTPIFTLFDRTNCFNISKFQIEGLKSQVQNYLRCFARIAQKDDVSIFTDRVRSTRGGNIFSLSVCPHPGGVPTFRMGGGTYSGLDGGWGGGVPTQVWMVGGVPTLRSGGGVPTQVWMGGVPTLRSGRGGTYSSLDGGGGGTYLPRFGWGGTYLPRWGGYLGRYPPPPEQYSVDWLRRGRYASCVLAQEDFLFLFIDLQGPKKPKTSKFCGKMFMTSSYPHYCPFLGKDLYFAITGLLCGEKVRTKFNNLTFNV